MHGQPVRRPIFRRDRPAHRLDIPPCEPQSDPEIACGGLARRLSATLGVVAVEDVLELFRRDPWTLISYGDVGEAAVASQAHEDLAAGRGERNRIVEQVLDDGFDHLFGAEYE